MQVWMRKDQKFSGYGAKSHIVIISALTMCDLTLKTAKQSFCTTLWLMVMHRHTKFGNKRFCDSEDIICSDLDLETSIQYFQDTLAHDDLPSN